MYKILEKQPLNPTVTKMVIDAPLVAKKAEPGQFIIFRAGADGERVPLTIADYNKAIMKEKENMVSGAISQGILKDATKQAEIVLTSIMKDMGFENIKITQEIKIPSPQ